MNSEVPGVSRTQQSIQPTSDQDPERHRMHARRHRENTSFRFKWLDDQQREIGFRRLKGCLDCSHLELEDFRFPLHVLGDILVQGRDIRLVATTDQGDRVDLQFRIWGMHGETFKSTIDQHLSKLLAAEHWRELERDGRHHEYRERDCPACGSTIVLSGYPETPQLYCDHCQALSDVDPTIADSSDSRSFGICDDCQMFSQPRSYAAFYFYFLFVEYGFYFSRHWRCPACMRQEAWKMLLLNAPFLIGIPWALWQLCRSYASSWIRGPYRGLDSANLHSRRGRLDQAAEGYLRIVERVPYCAGVKCNLADGFLAQRDYERAERIYREALADCANYIPAIRGIEICEKSTRSRNRSSVS